MSQIGKKRKISEVDLKKYKDDYEKFLYKVLKECRRCSNSEFEFCNIIDGDLIIRCSNCKTHYYFSIV